MATQCLTVHLTGNFRGKPALARFYRAPKSKGGDGWLVTVSVNGKSLKRRLTGRGWKPCWTVACEFFDELLPAKSRTVKPAKEDYDDGMILKMP